MSGPVKHKDNRILGSYADELKFGCRGIFAKKIPENKSGAMVNLTFRKERDLMVMWRLSNGLSKGFSKTLL
ncbi:hypothetical protein PHSC3_000749 [Chlamydiales bacterium STE3]|nr:hypothetical protein PHSC3_000749 [Chlamydiales bacterium STE3]